MMRLKLIAVAVAALAPVVTMLGYNEYVTRQQRSEEVRSQALQAARQASSEVERIVEGLHALLVAVTSMPAVRNGDAKLCNDALKSLAVHVANVRMIFVLRPDGVPICSSLDIPDGSNFADRPYFQAALATKDFVVGGYTKSKISGDAVLPLAMPVVEEGSVKAVIVSGIRLDWLQTRIEERGVSPGNAVTLADGSGTIVARVPFPERFVGTVIPADFLKLVHADNPGTVEVLSQDGTRRVLGYRPIKLPATPLYVSAGFSTAEAFAPINKASIYNSVGIAVGALIALLLSLYFGNRFILSPLSRILDVLDQWRNGEVSARTGMTGRDELNRVGRSLDRLLDELDCRRAQNEQAEEERTLLVRELAHRVKNGFTLVQAIARQNFGKTDPDKYLSFSERLSALAGTYDLILSREGASSPLRDVLSKALKAHLSEPDRICLSGPHVLLPADLALPLSLVTHELATNATKYGSLAVDGGRVLVDWTQDEDRLTVIWREIGGHAVTAPSRKGFGSVLIERAFPVTAGASSKADFFPDGLVFELTFSHSEHDASVVVTGQEGDGDRHE